MTREESALVARIAWGVGCVVLCASQPFTIAALFVFGLVWWMGDFFLEVTL